MSIALLTGIFEALPETDEQLCDRLLRNGDYLHASFKCPAGTWLGAMFSGPGDDEDDDDDEEDDQ